MGNEEYSPTVLRVILGLLFIVPGFDKFMGMIGDGHMVVGMLWGVAALAWLLALVELLCGLAVLAGWKVQWVVWPLVVVMLGAIFMAVVPMRAENPMWMIQTLFHLLAIAGLVSLHLTGPGAMAVEK